MLRILYAGGPGDAIGTYEHWKAGRDDPREVSLAFSGQFYSVCREMGAQALVIAQRAGGRHVRDGRLELREFVPPFQHSSSGVLYHVGQAVGAVRLAWEGARFGADVAVVAQGAHWFGLFLLRLLGIQVIVDLQCALWPKGHPPRGVLRRMVMGLNGWFWRHGPAATLCISPECARQVQAIARGRARNLLQTRPGYQRAHFAGLPAPDHASRPFVLLFAGRVERSKGVFDLLRVMRRLEAQMPGRFRCVICGAGSADAELAAEIRGHNLQHVIECTGQLHRAELLARIGRAHALIVPTTAAFTEGLNRVALESALAGRPAIVTAVCHVAEVVGDAQVVVAPGDVAGMAAAARRLADDAAFYAAAQAACGQVAAELYEKRTSWGDGLRKALELAVPRAAGADLLTRVDSGRST